MQVSVMPDPIYRLRPVPLKHRCDRCREEAKAIIEQLYLCGDCFFEESKKRYGIVAKKKKSS